MLRFVTAHWTLNVAQTHETDCNSTDQTSWRLTVCCSARQEMSRLLWNQKTRYRVYKSSEPVRKPSQMNLIQIPNPISSTFVLILSYHLRLSLPSELPSGFPTTFLYTFLIFAAHVNLLDVILIIFGEQCELWSSSLSNFLHPPVTPSILDPDISNKCQIIIKLKFCTAFLV
jgi:hypothetical protein